MYSIVNEIQPSKNALAYTNLSAKTALDLFKTLGGGKNGWRIINTAYPKRKMHILDQYGMRLLEDFIINNPQEYGPYMNRHRLIMARTPLLRERINDLIQCLSQ